MSKRSQSWKDLERDTAEALGGKRVLRGEDFSKSDVDVELPAFPHMKLDCKYKTAGWKHHSYLKEVQLKYCKQPGDVPVLVTKNKGEHAVCVTLNLRDFANLLKALEGAKYALRVGEPGPLQVVVTEKVG